MNLYQIYFILIYFIFLAKSSLTNIYDLIITYIVIITYNYNFYFGLQ